MTYLEPSQSRNTIDWVQWTVRGAAALSIGLIAWLTLTLAPNEQQIHSQTAIEPVLPAATIVTQP